MATKTLTITVCDVCGQEGTNLETYRVGRAQGALRKLDLCPTDAKAIKDLLGPEKRQRRQSREVLSEAEIRQSV